MCTMVYIPYGGTKVLASLRDESPLRFPAEPPAIFNGAEVKYIMPVDPAGGGTWVGANNGRSAVVLLNGAFERHIPAPPYRVSRGVIVRKMLDSKMPVVEWMLMPMENIEPYTLIVFTDEQLFRLTWDGAEKHRQALDAGIPHVFSSATLYNSEARMKREDLFRNWIAMRPPVDKLSLLNFFNSVNDSNNGFIINRDEQVRTLSYSFITMHGEELTFYYYDLRKYQFHSIEMTK